jgi:predicted lipoprotein with Yx(FWY)xxD motif
MQGKWPSALAFGAATALALGGCGSSSSSPTATVISTRVTNNPSLAGKPVLVDSSGFTLYRFGKDARNTTRSNCNGTCAAVWQPVILTGKTLAAGGSAIGSQLGTIKRSDGSLQVDYAGFPLYTYELDKKPGEALGNDVKSFGGTWFALAPSGQPGSG